MGSQRVGHDWVTKHSTHSIHSLVWQFPFFISQFFPDSTFRATGLTKKFICVFPNHVMGKPEQPFWPTQYKFFLLGSRSPLNQCTPVYLSREYGHHLETWGWRAQQTWQDAFSPAASQAHLGKGGAEGPPSRRWLLCVIIPSPGEGNGTPLSTLAWKIPWTEEPGRLQSMR